MKGSARQVLALASLLDKYDIKKESRTGYSIGIGYPPDWGEHTINISKGDPTILQPNVTFHMIAVMQFGDWGVEASHSLRVTESGSEKFSDFSSDIFIKVILNYLTKNIENKQVS